MLVITTLSAVALMPMFFRLSMAVIVLRRKHKISLGDGGNEDLTKAIRGHANFIEYTPFFLILIAALELNAAPWWLAAPPALMLVLGRWKHGLYSLHGWQGGGRVDAMKFTFYGMILACVLNAVWLVLTFGRLWL